MNLTRRVMLGTALAMAGGGAYHLGKSPGNTGLEADDEKISDLEGYARVLGEQQGLVIGFGDPKTFYVPPYMPEDAKVQNVLLSPVDREAVSDALKGIGKAFRAYPEQCLGKIIKAVFIAGKILIEGTEAGGTYGQDWIFVSAPRDMPPATRRLSAELVVHHETSSFPWLRSSALQAAFQALEPADWAFQTSTADQIAFASRPTPPVESGFLSSYGATTSENDFNTYVEILFSDPARMKNLAGRVPLIATKLALVLETYIKIDGRLRETFAGTGVLAAAGM